jgi:hypothetical protein
MPTSDEINEFLREVQLRLFDVMVQIVEVQSDRELFRHAYFNRHYQESMELLDQRLSLLRDQVSLLRERIRLIREQLELRR